MASFGFRSRHCQSNDVVLGDRNHFEITFLQPALEGGARSEGRDLDTGHLVLHPQICHLVLERLFSGRPDGKVADSDRRSTVPVRARNAVSTIQRASDAALTVFQFFGANGSSDLLRHSQLRASRARIHAAVRFHPARPAFGVMAFKSHSRLRRGSGHSGRSSHSRL